MKKYFYLLFFILVSCGKQQFATNKYAEEQSTSSIKTQNWNNPAYSQFTYIRPKVDFLIMIDNSGSYNYIKPKIEGSLRTLVDHISNDFDSQIAIAPLMGTGNSSEYYVIDEDPSNLIGVPNSQLIPLSQAGQKIVSFNPGLGKELGLDRTKSLYNDFRNKNIIRGDSHQMVVLISNGDHLSGDEPTPYDITTFAPQKYLGIKSTLTQQEQFRFFTVVPHTICNGVKQSYGVYRKVSGLFYNDVPNTFKTSYPTNGDSFDICGNFTNIFESINRTIQPEVLRHTYDYWPLVVTNDSNYIHDNDIDVDDLEVAIVDVNGNEKLLQKSTTDGYSYIGFQQGLQIRKLMNGVASRGEAYNGFFIKLNGQQNEVTNPSWVRIRTKTNTHYYGYVKLDYKPDPSSIKLIINGAEVPKSTTNGWEYLGGPSTRNIRIKGIGDYTPVTPAVTKSGWFIKLHGNKIYTNNSSINVHYFPQD